MQIGEKYYDGKLDIYSKSDFSVERIKKNKLDFIFDMVTNLRCIQTDVVKDINKWLKAQRK